MYGSLDLMSAISLLTNYFHLATYKTLKLDQVKLLNLEVEASERCFVVSKRKRGFFRWTAS